VDPGFRRDADIDVLSAATEQGIEIEKFILSQALGGNPKIGRGNMRYGRRDS
jgi:hypothetical protein